MKTYKNHLDDVAKEYQDREKNIFKAIPHLVGINILAFCRFLLERMKKER
jgi:hypothetical protein